MNCDHSEAEVSRANHQRQALHTYAPSTNSELRYARSLRDNQLERLHQYSYSCQIRHNASVIQMRSNSNLSQRQVEQMTVNC